MCSRNGFTLIEVIASLILIGIISVFATFGVVQVTNGYIQGVSNAVSSQKGSLALSRIYREFSGMKSITTASNDLILYSRDGATIGMALVGETLRMQEDVIPSDSTSPVLLDDVNSFSLSYIDMNGGPWSTNSTINQLARVDLHIVINDQSSSVSFQTSINPLYNNTYNGP